MHAYGMAQWWIAVNGSRSRSATATDRERRAGLMAPCAGRALWSAPETTAWVEAGLIAGMRALHQANGSCDRLPLRPRGPLDSHALSYTGTVWRTPRSHCMCRCGFKQMRRRMAGRSLLCYSGMQRYPRGRRSLRSGIQTMSWRMYRHRPLVGRWRQRSGGVLSK